MTMSRRETASLGIAVLLSAGALAAQTPFPAAGVDSVFAQYNRTDRPGCAVGVYRDGRIAYARGYGMADLNQGIAISPKTVFYIASTSKQFTAASLQLLAAQGKVSLDDPVRKYIPELPAYADAVTLRHLIYQLSGIRDYLGLWAISGRSAADEIPEEAALDLIARQHQLDFTPGTQWAYSNSNYFLMSVVVKRASGRSLREFARAGMFEPLGMWDTQFHDDRTMIVPRRAEGYEPDGKGAYRTFKTSFALVGDGGVLTTVEDLAKWDQNFFDNKLDGGGPAFIQRLYARGVLNSGDSTDYASGLFRHTFRGVPTIDHAGSFIGFRAELLRFPSLHTSIGVLCNDYTANPEAMAQRIATVVLADKLTAPATTVGAAKPEGAAGRQAALDRYIGRFELLPGVAGSVDRKGDSLQLSALGRTMTLTAVDDSTFTSDGLPGTFTFSRLSDGRTGFYASLLGMTAAAPPLQPAPVLSATERQRVVGTFFSDELQATFVVKEKGGRLIVRAGYGDTMPMEPFQPNEFSAGAAKVTAQRDRSGTVTVLVLDAGRMRNIKLVRRP
jgi:CubicO group peptidase (beta-lactamase class C family)